MRQHFLLAIFLGITVCSSFSLNPERFKSPDHIDIGPLSGSRLFPAKEKSDTSKRALRSYNELKKDKIEEERAAVPWIAYKLALKMGINPTDIFLHLRAVKPGGELESDPNIIRWLQCAMKYRAK
ncbi:hypothetical protein PI124_g19792 [Phytophthora idaei]|nr:hypothetical protein PI125_g12354 [Phytophthora idaei]KAG3147757.1 hypothetical protein PI126_g12756 [Phytophthora idaei]KAG3235168.1 hypothetical protein PI124_g19792 [Phytophthora idaei]